MSNSLRHHGLQHARPVCPPLFPGVCLNLYPLCWYSYVLISPYLCHPFLLLPSILPGIRVFSNELVLCIRWPKHWSFSFSISPSIEYSGLISFRIDWFNLLAVPGTLKSLLQHHSLKVSILWCSAFSLSLSLSLSIYIYNGCCLGRWTEERYNVVSSVQMFSDPWIHFHFANVPGLYPGGAWVTAGK